MALICSLLTSFCSRAFSRRQISFLAWTIESRGAEGADSKKLSFDWPILIFSGNKGEGLGSKESSRRLRMLSSLSLSPSAVGAFCKIRIKIRKGK